jgi:large subunit ribosomal protein L23
MENHIVVKRPLITEKGTLLREVQRQYLFEVDPRANKHQIKMAIEKLFNVHVEDVRTLKVRGKIKRVGANIGKRSNWKKAFVLIREGEKIEFFEGV